MQKDHQAAIFEIIKRKINGEDSLGNVLSDVLSISHDAVYRRYRGETQLTIYELEKIARHFSISLDMLFGVRENQVVFDFKPLSEYDFSMDGYLQRLHDGLSFIKAQQSPELVLAINNTHLIQLLNFPHLIRFKLFFWAKTYIQIEDYKEIKFKRDKIVEKTFLLGREVLQRYNSIPSKELFDPTLLRGFVREIQYYFNAQHFEDKSYALFLLEQLEGIRGAFESSDDDREEIYLWNSAPAEGNNFDVYFNETLNGMTSTFYRTADTKGLYITHNILNTLHTSDPLYVEESIAVLEKQLANASLISVINEKERNAFFGQIETLITKAKRTIEIELEGEI